MFEYLSVQRHVPVTKTHFIYHSSIMVKPPDHSNSVYYIHDQGKSNNCCSKVAVHIMWDEPEVFPYFIPRLGGMHFLLNVSGGVGILANDSGCSEVLRSSSIICCSYQKCFLHDVAKELSCSCDFD